MKVLYLGATWPQPWITAAGLRTVDLIKAFKSFNYTIDFFSIKKPNPFQTQAIKVLDVNHSFMPLNDEKAFKSLTSSPDICIFETSRLEEMFSHMLYNYYPKCLRILDTQDLHCLRLQRKEALLKNSTLQQVKNLPIDFADERACKEFAGILRSHSTILTSTHEENIVKTLFPGVKSVLIPFMYNNIEIKKHRRNFSTIENRKNFVWIGNFMHEPNVDALEFTLKYIWPKVYANTGAEFHIYGGHCPKEDKYQGPGVFVKGTMKSLKELGEYRCLLAYIRFGAGIKGKVVDSFYYGLPVITTSLGSEGIDPFPGFVEDDVGKFIELASKMYGDNQLFKYQKDGFNLLEKKFSMDVNKVVLEEHVKGLQDHPLQHILFGETLRSTAYFSKYIEMKNNRKV